MLVLIFLTMFTLSAQSPEESHTLDRIDNFHHVQEVEERFSVKTAFCCRISGNVVDVSGSIISYVSAGLATISAFDSLPSRVRTGLAISAGIGAILAGVLHNLKPVVHKIAKEKQERAEELHRLHLSQV